MKPSNITIHNKFQKYNFPNFDEQKKEQLTVNNRDIKEHKKNNNDIMGINKRPSSNRNIRKKINTKNGYNQENKYKEKENEIPNDEYSENSNCNNIEPIYQKQMEKFRRKTEEKYKKIYKNMEENYNYDIAILNKENKNKEINLKFYKEKYGNVLDENEKMKEKNNKELIELEKKYNELKNEKEREIIELNKKYDELESKYNLKVNSYDSLQKKMNFKSETLKKYENENSFLKKEKNDLNEKISELKNKIEKKKFKIKKLKEEKESLENKNNQLNEQNRYLINENKSNGANTFNNKYKPYSNNYFYEEEMKKKDSMIEDLQKENFDLKNRNYYLDNLKFNLEKELNEKKRQIDYLNNRNENEMIYPLNNNNMRYFSNDFSINSNNYRNINLESNGRYNILRQDNIEKLELKNENLEFKNKELNFEIQTKNNIIKDLNKKIGEYKKRIDNLTNQLNQYQIDEDIVNNDEILFRINNNQPQYKEIDDIETKIRQLNNSYDELKKQNNELKEKVEKNKELEKKYKELEKEYKEKEEKCKELEKKCKELEKECNNFEFLIEQKNNIINRLQSEKEELKESIKPLNSIRKD